MGATRSPVDGVAAATMLLLCAIWGAQQVAIKLAAPDVAPVVQVALRYGLSAVLVGALVAWRGEGRSWRRTWRPGLLVGVLFAVEFLAIAEGLARTSASHLVVFLYTAPVFAALGLHAVAPAERLTRSQWLGIVVAFAGIALAFLGGGGSGGPAGATVAGDLLAVLAGALWGATTVVLRGSSLNEAPAAQTLLYQLVCAFVLIGGFACVSARGGAVAMTRVAWVSILFQGIVVSAASYLTWFWLLRRYLATGLSVFSFMTPIFGVALGVVVLGEPLSPTFVAGAVLVLAGITVVSGAGLVRRRA